METVKKIDMHVHVIKTAGGLPRFDGTNFCTPDELREMYGILGVEKGVLLPSLGPESGFDTNTNREIMEVVKENPDLFYWFCNIDPRNGCNNETTDFSYFLSFYKANGARGVGELCGNLPFDDPMYLNLFKHCEKCGMPVLFHIGVPGGDYGVIDERGLPRLEKVLGMFPKLIFIGHSQKFWSHIGAVSEEEWQGYPTGKVVSGRVPELMRKYQNLHADLSAGSGYNALARDPEFAYGFLEEFKDRLYFGTDICAPSNITSRRVKTAAFLDEAMLSGKISYDAYFKISRGNALKILEG